MMDEHCVRIFEESDIVSARERGKQVAERGGFTGSDLTIIATVISELARNIFEYAVGPGEICVGLEAGERPAFVVIACDDGPGIPDVEMAMTDGFSTGNGLGLGLPGVRRLMEDFQIDSGPGRGTRVVARKRLRR